MAPLQQAAPSHVWRATCAVSLARHQLSGDRERSEQRGVVVNHRFFDSFGRLLYQSDNGHIIVFGFTGVYFEIATGLQNHRNRWLDVELGRWVSEDPIGFLAGDTNLNAYVGNAPTMYVDPTGLWEEPTMWDAIKGGGVGGFWRWLGGGTPNEGQVHDANRAHELRMQLLGETGGDKSSLGAWKREVGSMPGAALDCAQDTAINVTVTIIPGPVDDAIAKGNEVRKGAQFGKAALTLNNIASKGVSVIGPRATYRHFAKKLGARFLDIADADWTWAKNEEYLAGVVQRGDDVVFAGTITPGRLGGRKRG